MVHPPSSSRGRHHRRGVVVMMKLDATIAAMILSTTTECIDPVRRLCCYVVLHPRDAREGVAEPRCICERLMEMSGFNGGQMSEFKSQE